MEEKKIKQTCWDNAIHSYGTGYIFQQRAALFRNRIKVLTFLGIVVPLSIGSIVMSFGQNQKILETALIVAGILGFLQLIGSAWSLVAKWDDSYSYSLESTSVNYKISHAYKKQAESSIDKSLFDSLEQEYQSRMDMDNKQGISEDEKREGMRAALRQFQRNCAQCKQVPFSMSPSNCDVCGNFKRKRI